MSIPTDLKYTTDHEWLRLEGEQGVIGITDFAQDALGGVVFVELPAVGTVVEQGAAFGVVESNKAVSDLYAPVSGEIVAVNEALTDQPELVNDAPYDGGWMVRLTLADPAQVTALLDSSAYAEHVAREGAE